MKLIAKKTEVFVLSLVLTFIVVLGVSIKMFFEKGQIVLVIVATWLVWEFFKAFVFSYFTFRNIIEKEETSG